MCVVLFGSSSLKYQNCFVWIPKSVYCSVVSLWNVSIYWYELWKKYAVLFGGDSLKMSELLDLNAENKYIWELFGSNSLKVSKILDINAEKKCVVLFGSNYLNVSELLDMNSEKKYVVLLVSNSLKVSELLDMNAEKSII